MVPRDRDAQPGARRIWLGPAGCGKTARCLSDLRACEREGRAALWIVPEQFTYAADRRLLDDPSLPGLRFARVMSFGRLAELAAARASQRPGLTEEGRRLLLRRLVEASPPAALGPFAPIRRTPGFVEALARVVQEMKGIAGPEAASRLAAVASSGPQAAALAALLGAYDAALARSGLEDPSERVHRVAAHLARDPGPWAAASVWIDGFASFTPEEKALLRALDRFAPRMTITLCADPQDARLALQGAREAAEIGLSPASSEFIDALRPRLGRPAFLPALRTLLWLDGNLAGPPRIEPCDPASDARPRFAEPELDRLERELFRTPPPGPRAAGPGEPAVSFALLPTPYHEVADWARWVDRSVRLEGGLRYREVAVMVRDLEAYRPLVRDVFAHYGIPVFLDLRRDATAHPLLRLVLGALRLARGWSREALIAVLRNPLLGVPPETVDRIENLSLEYGIEYERWRQTDWSVPRVPAREAPEDEAGDAGLADEEVEPPAALTRASRAEARRRGRERAAAEAREVAGRLFPALAGFTDPWRSGDPTFAAAVAALEEMLRALAGAPRPAERAALWKALGSWAAAERTGWTEDESRQVTERLAGLLEEGLALMPEVRVSPALLARLLKDALGQAAIGTVPQSLDAVLIAEPRRSRVDEVERVILGGLAASSFPRVHAPDAILSDADRERLAGAGLPIAASTEARAEEEPYLFYVAVTRARGALRLTAPARDDRGGAAEPSSYLAEVRRALDRPLEAERTRSQPDLAGCQHPAELGPALGHHLSALAPERTLELLDRARRAMPQAEEALARAERQAACRRTLLAPEIPPEVVSALHPGRVLNTSASGLETFAACPFRHFARHVLRLEKRPEAILTPLSTGSAVHAALERFFADPEPPDSPEAARARLETIFRALADEEDFAIFQADPPSAYRWELTGRNLARFIRAEHRRLERSTFRPAAVELGFGAESATADDAARLRERLEHAEPAAGARLPALEFTVESGAGETWRVRLRGRIDRLDVSTGGDGPRLGLVVDYKSRAAQRSPRERLERGHDLQLAAYLWVVRDVIGLAPAGGVYYSVRPCPHAPGEPVPEANELRFAMQGFVAEDTRAAVDPEAAFGLKAASSPAAAIDETLATARGQIARLAAGIVGGRIRPDPQSATGRLPCEICDFREMCRYDRAAGTRSAEGSEP